VKPSEELTSSRRTCLTKCRSNVDACLAGLMTTGQSQLGAEYSLQAVQQQDQQHQDRQDAQLTWGGGAVTSACQPSRGSGGREAAGLHRAEAPKAEACQGRSEGGVVHLRIPPPWSAKAEGGPARGPVAGCASTNHVLLKQSQVILESQNNFSRLQTAQCIAGTSGGSNQHKYKCCCARSKQFQKLDAV